MVREKANFLFRVPADLFTVIRPMEAATLSSTSMSCGYSEVPSDYVFFLASSRHLCPLLFDCTVLCDGYGKGLSKANTSIVFSSVLLGIMLNRPENHSKD